jgi:hypothetical protein
MRIPSADSIRSPRGAYAPRSWLRLRTLLQMCDSGRTFVNAPSTHAYSICRLDTFTTGGLRPPLLVACATHRVRYAFPIRNGKDTVFHGGLTPPLMMHGPVAFRLLLTLFGAYLFESSSCLRAGSGCCLRCSEVNQA